MDKQERIRVLWLIKGLGLGGAEMLFDMAAPYLDRERFEYEIGYFLPWKDALVERLAAKGLHATCFEIRHALSFRGLRRLQAYCRQRRLDVIHMHLPMPGVYGRVAGRLAGVPAIVYTEHNVWSRLNPFSRLLNRWSFPLNDAVIAVSEDVRLSMAPRCRARAQTIDNGIDLAAVQASPADAGAVRAELGIPPGAVVIGKVANLTPKKNHELLLDAFALVRRQVPQAFLVLVGQFAGRDGMLRERAQRLGIQSSVLFAGPRTDVLRVLAAVDIFALSSDYEGLPIALLEAMALGKPVVSTAVGGVPRVVREGAEGFLVAPGNATALAESLQILAQDADLRTTLGQAAAQRIRHSFDIAAMVRKVEAVYLRVLEEKCKIHGLGSD